MSRTALRKELDKLDKQQLVELVLNAYSASKETKAYLEFFLNPDADALLDAKTALISKELTRSRRGFSKARISVIRSVIRDFEAYGVGAEYTARLMLAAIRMIVGMERYYNFSSTMTKGTERLVREYIALADRNGFAREAIDNMAEIVSVSSKIGRPAFRNFVRRVVEDACSSLPENI